MAEQDRPQRRVSDATRARIDELAAGWSVDLPAQPSGADDNAALPSVTGVRSTPFDGAATATAAPALDNPTNSGLTDDSPALAVALRQDPGEFQGASGTFPPSGTSKGRKGREGRKGRDTHGTPVEGARSGIDPTPHSLSGSAAHPGQAGVIDPSPRAPQLPAIAVEPDREPTEESVDIRSVAVEPTSADAMEPIGARDSLARKPGIPGDVSYVVSAIVGIRKARAEIRTLDARGALRRTSRDHHLVTLGRSALALGDNPGFAPSGGARSADHERAAVDKAREAVHANEVDRARHVAAVRAAEAELERIRRARDESVKAHREDLATCDAEIAEFTKKLRPLVGAVAVNHRRAVDLDYQMRRIANRIAATEAKLGAVAGGIDPAALRAEIAALRADRQSVQRDEAKLTAEIGELDPQVAALRTQLRDAHQRRRELIANDAEHQSKTTELLDAVGARRRVDERAATETEVTRDKILRELGERMCAARSVVLTAQIAPIDQIDAEIADDDRRIGKLDDLIASFDRMKFARGVVEIALAVSAVVAGLWFAL